MSAAKNPKAHMIYVYKGHKECKGFPLWRANRCRTHLYLKGHVADGTEILWRKGSGDIEKI